MIRTELSKELKDSHGLWVCDMDRITMKDGDTCGGNVGGHVGGQCKDYESEEICMVE